MVKVVIVEDNPIFREAFKKGLLDHFPSMVIEEAANSDEAFQKIKGSPPNLIFMDVRLPGINGLQLTQKIKAGFPDIIIAMMTDYDLPEYRQAAVQYGADHYYIKNSFEWDEIGALVLSISAGGR